MAILLLPRGREAGYARDCKSGHYVLILLELAGHRHLAMFVEEFYRIENFVKLRVFRHKSILLILESFVVSRYNSSKV